MIVLDTNVVSEMIRASPNAVVLHWLAAQPGTELWITVITEAELRFGAALLPSGRRRQLLEDAIQGALEDDLAGRVLPFERAAAAEFAFIVSERRKIGRPINDFDAQIAAIARVHGAAVATRDVGDFAHCGIELINPWAS